MNCNVTLAVSCLYAEASQSLAITKGFSTGAGRAGGLSEGG
ncbi:hypothetical protein CLV42_104549 [Chitinophaga ginsengisoli]|uniref:Uncharacterized protein n=1 Tax=Chitinophaga ginsengisoli TaxID=363837 RepID=A0A2P8GE67_9BACT|nr:hypothetical protein CLV42_104549 [Chitinophaga ginsengisoli]